jgi:tRNA (mo5U34)-methyltransferase
VLNDLPNGGGRLISPIDGAVSIQSDAQVDGAILKRLTPWRKGPFRLNELNIDAEWRSQMKWDRFLPHVSRLSNARVLDIGCGNGYYMFRMLEHCPSFVLGIDPSHLTMFQFLAIQQLIQSPILHYLPIGWSDLDAFSCFFDAVFCLGILYHHRSPMALLESIRSVGTPGGSLFFDTLIMDGSDELALFPRGRYAKMPNVYFIPTLVCLKNMLLRAGFTKIDILSVDRTTINEQRSTPWTFEQSLEHFLDPKDSTKTVEGYPAPMRVALVATLQRF